MQNDGMAAQLTGVATGEGGKGGERRMMPPPPHTRGVGRWAQYASTLKPAAHARHCALKLVQQLTGRLRGGGDGASTATSQKSTGGPIKQAVDEHIRSYWQSQKLLVLREL